MEGLKYLSNLQYLNINFFCNGLAHNEENLYYLKDTISQLP